MRIIERNIKLPEGHFDVKLQYFEEKDREVLLYIYDSWRDLCVNLKSYESRAINLPEGLSEGAFSLEMNVARLLGSISGANSSFDCYSEKNTKRIQVKACSILPDLTSFGPKSVWDEIYFCDFFRDGNWDGSFDIYLIPNELIYDHKVNSTQTVRDQQLQGRRPRFSIFTSIIQDKQLIPIKTGRLF
jgi:hypothetical protein